MSSGGGVLSPQEEFDKLMTIIGEYDGVAFFLSDVPLAETMMIDV